MLAATARPTPESPPDADLMAPVRAMELTEPFPEIDGIDTAVVDLDGVERAWTGW